MKLMFSVREKQFKGYHHPFTFLITKYQCTCLRYTGFCSCGIMSYLPTTTSSLWV